MSEGERTRKSLIKFLTDIKEISESGRTTWAVRKEDAEICKSFLDYLEKQKEASKAIEAVDRIDKYIDERVANAHDMKDSNPDKKYYRGWDDALGEMARILQDVYSGEKQKETLHISETCKENADSFTDIKDRNIRGCIGMALADVSESRFKMYGVTLKECLAYLENRKSKVLLTKEEEYILHRIIEYLEDETCPSEWINLLHDIYCLPYEKQKETDIRWFKSDNVKNPDKPYIDKAGMFYTTDGRMCYASEIEKQKEQKPVEPSDDELQRHQDELHNFKVFAAKQAKEYHISFVHDFEWNNFCAELLSYFNEQKPEWSEEDETAFGDLLWCIKQAAKSAKDENDIGNVWFAEHWVKGRLKSLCPQPEQKWSEEDEKFVHGLIRGLTAMRDIFGRTTFSSDNLDITETINWLKSLRPQYHGDVTMTEAYKMGLEAGKASSWKPSEKQTNNVIVELTRVELGDIINGLYYLKEKYYEDCKEHNGTATVGLSDEFKFYFKRFNEVLDLYTRLHELEKEKYGTTADGYYYE